MNDMGVNVCGGIKRDDEEKSVHAEEGKDTKSRGGAQQQSPPMRCDANNALATVSHFTCASCQIQLTCSIADMC